MSTEQVEAHVLKKYSLLKKVGSGAYGHVWKVTDKKSGETLALKKIFDAFQHSTDAQRTYRQIVFLHELNHPNIIKLYNVIRAENDKDLYLVFEYMEADLHNAIGQKILKDAHNRYIIYQLMKGLKFMHSAQVIHRDLKPSNLLLNSDCNLKICDYGLARSMEVENGIQKDSVLTEEVATRWYRAPEVLLGSNDYGKSADIWSAGCILAEVLVGKPVFPGNSTLNQLQKILTFTGKPKASEIASLNASNAATMFNEVNVKQRSLKQWFKADVPGDAIDLVTSMLSIDPSKRPTASQVLKHPYLSSFHKPREQISAQKAIKPPISDSTKLNVKEYRKLIYERIQKLYSNSTNVVEPINGLQYQKRKSVERTGKSNAAHSNTHQNHNHNHSVQKQERQNSQSKSKTYSPHSVEKAPSNKAPLSKFERYEPVSSKYESVSSSKYERPSSISQNQKASQSQSQSKGPEVNSSTPTNNSFYRPSKNSYSNYSSSSSNLNTKTPYGNNGRYVSNSGPKKSSNSFSSNKHGPVSHSIEGHQHQHSEEQHVVNKKNSLKEILKAKRQVSHENTPSPYNQQFSSTAKDNFFQSKPSDNSMSSSNGMFHSKSSNIANTTTQSQKQQSGFYSCTPSQMLGNQSQKFVSNQPKPQEFGNGSGVNQSSNFKTSGNQTRISPYEPRPNSNPVHGRQSGQSYFNHQNSHPYQQLQHSQHQSVERRASNSHTNAGSNGGNSSSFSKMPTMQYHQYQNSNLYPISSNHQKENRYL